MATNWQVIKNRINSERSTGPNTPEGKQRSAQNSFKHGLTGAQIVVPGESPEEFERMKAQMIAEWQPANLDERQLVLQIANSWWRLQRAYRIEAVCLDFDAQDSGTEDPDTAVGNGFWNNFPRYEILRRYIGSIERSWNRAKDELRRVQAERRRAQLPSKPIKPQQLPKIGFVSQPPSEPPAEPARQPVAHSSILSSPPHS